MANRVTRTARGPRRRTHWARFSGAATVFSSSSSVIMASSATGHEGETLVRVRGALDASLSGVTAANDGFQCALGIGLVTTAAFNAGVASVPVPISDAGWDGWLLHRFFDLRGGIVGDGSVASAIHLELDSKAMRKANEDETLIAVLQAVESGTATMNVFFQSRILSMVG